MGNGSGVVNGVSVESPSLGGGEGNDDGRSDASAGFDESTSNKSTGLLYCRAVLYLGKDRPSSSLLDSSDLVSRERLLDGVECSDEVREELSEGERRSGSEYWFLRSDV